MLKIQICLASVLVCALFSTAAAQESTTAKTTLTITANANGDRVRVTAPSSVVQLHLEVYAAGGEKVFDQELRGANVFDWHLQNGQAQRLAAGDYVCVITAKTISGKLSQKLGAVTVAENSARLRPGNPQQLSLPQTQAIGPVEAESSWTIPGNDEPQTPTVIANDGTNGQMIRGRGALTFRIGNFFSGIDTEQMRLTEAGDLGIGTSTPQSKLDVAGAIRAERFLVVKPKLASGDKTTTGPVTTDASDSVQPLIAGTGTQNQISKWIDNAGTLGDSGITESAGNIGIGTTTPGAPLEAYKAAGANATGGGVLVSRYNDGAGTFRGGAIYSRFISAANYDALIFGVTSTGTKNPYADFDQARMAILGNGNVGLGTTTPGAPLEAYKAAGANVNGGGVLVSRYNDGAGTFRGGAIYSRYITGGGEALVLGVTGDGTKNPYADFDQARMFILDSGRVGIGTTAPGATLDVAGTVNSSEQYNIRGNRVLTISGDENRNTFVGYHAGRTTLPISGDNNSFFGIAAGSNNNSGDYNTFLGALAGQTNSSGSYNTFVGGVTGGDVAPGAGDYITLLGFGAGFGFANNLDHATAIGAGAFVDANNTIKLGRSNGDDTVIIPGKLQIDTLAAAGNTELCLNSNNRVGPCSASSLRYKKAVQPFFGGLKILNRLQPITFTWKHDGLPDLGLAAEEVALVEPMLTFKNKEGEIEGVKYNRVNLVLINAVKEQQQQIAALRSANDALNGRLQLIERTLKNNRGSTRQRR